MLVVIKIPILLGVFLILLGGISAKAAPNYQSQKDPLNKELRNPIKENLNNSGKLDDGRYNKSQTCDFIEEIKQFTCQDTLQPRITKSRQPIDMEKKAPIILNK